MLSSSEEEKLIADPASKAYALPFANAMLESFLKLAAQERKQAEAAVSACRQAITVDNNDFAALYASPRLKQSVAAGMIRSAKAQLLAAEAAQQAQAALCDTLAAAAAAAGQQISIISRRIQEVGQEIAALEQQARQLRSEFTQATDQAQISEESYTTVEAKRLLSCLEKAYQQHELLQNLQQSLSATEANAAYIGEECNRARQQLGQTAALLEQAEAEWRRFSALLQISPDGRGGAEAQPEAPPPQPAPETPADIPAEGKEESGRSSAWPIIWSYVKIIATAILIAFFLRAYFFDVTDVEGVSMYPTLHDGDHLITSKISYLLDEPERGDIIVFNAPDSPGDKYIKRIIGLPNESILIEDGKIYIDNQLLDEPYLNGLETGGDVYTIIPDGYYFVMGDNRDESRDSRSSQVGMISIDSFSGKAVLRIYPFSAFGAID